MKISYNWLKKYIDVDFSIDDIADIATSIGLEIEAIEKVESIKGGLEGIVVGEVLSCEKHPDADKLQITTVDYGDGIKTIVCGAENVATGEKVVVATVGSILYPSGGESFKIKKSKIRGVESLGMLCAEDELGLGNSHDGIILLDKTVKIGTSAKEVFNLREDYILEVGLTPNRVDAASHWGFARDIASWMKYNGKNPNLRRADVSNFKVDNTNSTISVEVEAVDKAPRYMALAISGVSIMASPAWLQDALRSIGLSPKNNIVDITNYVLHELGQPLHAFDLDSIEGGKVVVREATLGEKFTTLDGVERVLSTEDLVICDSKKPMCLAGVLGGENSGVNESTKNIFLECAYFSPVTIRKSAKRHLISSDASFRYERGTDPNILEYAIMRAAMLIQEIAGGDISSKIIEQSSRTFSPFEIKLSIDRTEKLIGKKIGKESIISILEALDIEVKQIDVDTLELQVPQYRVDVQREADIVEEIMRIYGFNNIEVPSSVRSTLSYSQSPDQDKIQNRISDFLTANSFHEIMGNSLTKSTYYEPLKEFGVEQCVKIANPLSGELNVMRQTLLFNALEAVELNINRKNSNLKLYEFGNCYYYNPENIDDKDMLSPYRHQYTFSMLVTGNSSHGNWNTQSEQSTIYSIKLHFESILKMFGLNINSAQFAACTSDIYSDAVAIKLKNRDILNYGVVSKTITKKFGIKQEVYYAEINFDNLIEIIKGYNLTVEPLSKYPAVSRDLAMLVDKSVSFIDLYNIATKCEKRLLKSISLFDVYEGEKLPEGKKSYALNFMLEDTTKTLTDTVIDKCMNNFIFQFEKQLNAQIRK